MNDQNNKEVAEAVGRQLGEVLVLFLGVVNALRKQPAFDDASFRKEIKALLERPSTTEIQGRALEELLTPPLDT